MNVLFITADQWRGDCLSCVGHPAVRTPNLDRLAGEGALFTRHFAQATPCGPSRASLHTGMYAFNHRSVTNGTPLDARHKTLAGLVRAAGGDPVLFGYTDTSADPRALPPDSPWLRTYEGVAPGFRVELRLPEAEGAYFEHLARRGYGRLAYDEVYGAGFERPAPFRAEDSVTAFLADRFLTWLEGQGGAPWFAHVSFIKPHPPFVASEPWYSAVSPGDVPPPVRAGTPELEAMLHPWLAVHLASAAAADPVRRTWIDGESLGRLRAVYFGLIAEVDHHVGRMVAELERRGDLGRTLIVFSADHGELLGDHWMLGKAGFFPQAFHVPLLIRHPSGVRGRRVSAFTEHVDLMPTVLEALGLPIPRQCDGHSLSGFLTGRFHVHGEEPPVGSTISGTLWPAHSSGPWACRATPAPWPPSSTASAATFTSPPCRRSTSPTAPRGWTIASGTRKRRPRSWSKPNRCCPGGCWPPSGG